MSVSVRALAAALALGTLASCPCEPRRAPPGPDFTAVGLTERPKNETCKAPARPVLASDIAVSEPWPDLEVTTPVFMLQEPGSTSMVVISRGGTVYKFDKNDAAVTVPEVWGDLSTLFDADDTGENELGLLGFAFHPDWPAVPQVFVAYAGEAGGAFVDVVARLDADDAHIDAASEVRLLSVNDPFFNHDGGMISFSPTDPCRTCLYYGDGDGGAGDDPFSNGQNRQTFMAKILRIDVDGRDPGKEYGVPPDNPFVDDASFLPEIYAYGLRNPWRFSFDRGSGDLWVGDVGQNRIEEIDVVEAGGNYGWDILEADNCHDQSAGSCTQGGFEAPVVQYNHQGPRNCVVGGYVYRGAAMPAHVGNYFYADHTTGEIFELFFDAQGAPAPLIVADLTTEIASFAEDADGELYVMDHVTGRISRLAQAGAPPPDDFPTTLSATGCADPSDATKPAAGLIPYDVNLPLYSDGAEKQRFIALPDGASATFLEDGDIDFPVGTVFVKSFAIAGQRVETRLLVHHDDGDWGGYSYEWNEAGTDADLVPPAGKSKLLPNGQLWTYPSRNGCLACHSLAAHRQLGWEAPQLNKFVTYDATGITANQLVTFDAIGVFDGPLPAQAQDLPAFPALDDDDRSVEERARAYVHVNCAICHRPGGIGVADTDWRFDTSFRDMKACDVAPTEGDLGVDGAKRLVPGDPDKSLMSLRMKKLGAGRMPLIGSAIVDDDGTRILDAWIASLRACP